MRGINLSFDSTFKYDSITYLYMLIISRKACQRSLHNKERDRQMSRNDYTIELITTQLVILENNTANHSPQSKKYSTVRTVLELSKMSKTTKYFYSTAQCHNVHKL
jgi:hypothetical protein